MKAGQARASRSCAAASIHEGVLDLRKIGMVDEKTMRKFDEMCLTRTDSEGDISGSPNMQKENKTVE